MHSRGQHHWLVVVDMSVLLTIATCFCWEDNSKMPLPIEKFNTNYCGGNALNRVSQQRRVQRIILFTFTSVILTVKYWLTFLTLWCWQINHLKYIIKSSLFTDWAAKSAFCEIASLATASLWALSMQSLYSALIWLEYTGLWNEHRARPKQADH